MREGCGQDCRQASPLHMPRHTSSWRPGAVEIHQPHQRKSRELARQAVFLCFSGKASRTLISRCHRTAEGQCDQICQLSPPPTPPSSRSSWKDQGSRSPLLSQAQKEPDHTPGTLLRIPRAYLSLDDHCRRPHRNQKCPLGVVAAAADSCHLGTPLPPGPQCEPGEGHPRLPR